MFSEDMRNTGGKTRPASSSIATCPRPTKPSRQPRDAAARRPRHQDPRGAPSRNYDKSHRRISPTRACRNKTQNQRAGHERRSRNTGAPLTRILGLGRSKPKVRYVLLYDLQIHTGTVLAHMTHCAPPCGQLTDAPQL